MAANESKLGKLHEKLAEVLSSALEDEVSTYVDDDGETQETRIKPSAAIMQVAAKFLKDNNITCAPSQDNALGELAEQMRRQRERRASVTSADKADAEQGMSFMTGVH